MAARILVAMADAPMSDQALAFALETFPDADITVVHIVGVPGWWMAEAATLALANDIGQAVEDRAATVFERARSIAEEYDRDIVTVADVGHPARAILRRAGDFDHVVIGSHARNLDARILLGNVAEAVTRRAPVPVTVVR